jgi:penicillin V acylase-like amidase (Ntn superfamily)
VNRLAALLTSVVALAALSAAAFAGTEMQLRPGSGAGLSARSFDFSRGDGLLRFSPAGTTHRAQIAVATDQAMVWKSKYAVLGFDTLFGKPGGGVTRAGVDGINAAGLKVGAYLLPETVFPPPGPRRTLDVGMLMQYWLDNFATVEAALNDLNRGAIRVAALPAPEIKLHFYLHDASGAAAIVEFLDGRVEIVRNPDVAVLANAPYRTARSQLAGYAEFGGAAAVPGGRDSLDRFVRAAYTAKHLPAVMPRDEAIHAAFAAIQTVTLPPGADALRTQWMIVTDIAARRVSFRTFSGAGTAFVDLAELAQTVKGERDVDLMRPDLLGNIAAKFLPPRPAPCTRLKCRQHRR